jgi:hypothetical protein
MRRSELLERLYVANCSAKRATEVEYLVTNGDIIEPNILRYAINASDKAFSAFVDSLGVQLPPVSGEVIAASRKRDDDEDEDDDEECSRIARNATLRATKAGEESCSGSALKKAVRAKRASQSTAVDRQSLKRNGLAMSDDHESGAAHAPGPLGESSMEQCRLSQDASGTPGEREANVVRRLRQLEGGR